MEEQDVGLVSEDGIGDASSLRGVVDASEGVEEVAGFGQRLLPRLRGCRQPRSPVESSEVVEGVPALESLGGAQVGAPFAAAVARSQATTASTMAATLSTGVVGRIPCPRFNTCPPTAVPRSSTPAAVAPTERGTVSTA